MHKFKDINFEYTDAQEERLHAPNISNILIFIVPV